MNHDLIVFGEDWGALPSSTQHLINHLSKTRKVIWINSIGLRRPTFSIHDFKRAYNKLFSTNKKSVSEISRNIPANNNFRVIHPRTLPCPKTKLGRWIAWKLLVSQIKPVSKLLKLYNPILWTSLPTAVDVAGHLDESALVYYCGDDFSALAGVDHETVAKRESELLDKADLIIAASDKLAKRFPTSRTRLLQHGVDYALFTKISERATDLPNDGQPIAGFYGSISEWLNLDLLIKTINKLPDWHFVFIGKPVIDISSLESINNVTFLGERPHSSLPSYCQHWTASLLPFLNSAQIQACNPLKLKEYLAAGRPIITTDFPAIQPYKGLVQSANTVDAMVQALEASIHIETLPAFTEAVRETVVEHDWKRKSETLSLWLESL